MDFKEYIQGKRKGKKANQFERNAMNDPFLQEAIDGFDTIDGDHISIIENLEKKIEKRSITPEKKRNRSWVIGIAASAILLLGIGSLFILDRTITLNDPVIVSSHIDFSDKIIDSIEDKIVTEKQTIISKKEPDLAPSIPALPSVTPSNKQKSPTATHTREGLNRNNENHAIAEEPPALSVLEIDSMEEIEIMPLSEKLAESNASKIDNSVSGKLSGTRPILSGTVTDEIGEPIIGATVMFRGTDKGTVTDLNGKYSIEVMGKENKTLIASYIGYETKEIPVTEVPSQINMQPSSDLLNEVVVVGYGKEKNKKLSGAVSKVDTQKKFNNEELLSVDDPNINSTNELISIPDKEAFQIYFEQQRAKELCNKKKARVAVKFYIDQNGIPINILINKSTCEELEKELLHVLRNSPPWETREKEISLTIRIN